MVIFSYRSNFKILLTNAIKINCLGPCLRWLARHQIRTHAARAAFYPCAWWEDVLSKGSCDGKINQRPPTCAMSWSINFVCFVKYSKTELRPMIIKTRGSAHFKKADVHWDENAGEPFNEQRRRCRRSRQVREMKLSLIIVGGGTLRWTSVPSKRGRPTLVRFMRDKL